LNETEKLIAKWMEWLFIVRGRQPRGVEQYATVVRGFFAWLESQHPVDIQTVSTADVEEWMKALFYDFNNISNQSRASKLSALRSFFDWLKYANYRSEDPTKGIPTPRIHQSLPQKFSTEELRLLFASPDKSKLMGLRDLAILKTLYAAGPRVSELCNLDLNHISDTGGYIRLHFIGGKGNKDRLITLRRNPSKTLREWILARQNIETSHNALFVRLKGKSHTRLSVGSAQDVLKKYARVVGITDVEVFAHKMRGTFASDLYDSGDDKCPRCGCGINHVDLLRVQLALGHEDPKTTVPYIAISDRHLKRTAIPDKRFNEIEEE
jgi:site-specific recombinase XerD